MFKIKITGISEATGLITQGWPSRTVSLIDTIHDGGKWVEPQDSHLITYCDDCERDLPQHGYLAPTRAQIAKILDFTSTLTDEDVVLVHCHAGISRSTATAIAMLVQHGMTPKAAIDYIQEIRPQVYPNQLIIDLADDILGLEGRLSHTVTVWKQTQAGGLTLLGQL